MIRLAASAERAALVSHFGDCVVATLRDDLDRAQFATFRGELLEAVRSQRARGVVLDASALEVVDTADFARLRQTLEMVELMGARTVLVGLRPDVVAALVELGADIDGIAGELTLEAGLARVRSAR
jgi:rsbT antagonist protein RsbS